MAPRILVTARRERHKSATIITGMKKKKKKKISAVIYLASYKSKPLVVELAIYILGVSSTCILTHCSVD